MKIKQVEELVGITSKNIRFYEDQDLITPERLDNGYREYHDEHIQKLQKIKLLRKIGVSIEDIKKLFCNEQTLNDCLEKQLQTLEKEKSNIENMHILTQSILHNADNINDLDTNHWLDEVEKMEKEGIDFVDTSKVDVHMKKKAGAWLGGLFVIIISILMIGLFIWLKVTSDLPLLFALILIGIHVVTIICVLVVIRMRLKEIDGGEEDEASKY